jgi:2-keto-4-pentenoate hydratase
VRVSTGVADAVTVLERAAAQRTPCAPVRSMLDADIGAAYEVQSRLTARRQERGARPVGRKIGLTSPAVQRQLGVDRPDFGMLFDDMAVPEGGVVPTDLLLQPKVEGELAFRLGADLDGPISGDAVRAAIATAHAAIEIVDSRIAGWDISIVDTVADNASSGMFVVARTGVPLTGTNPADVEMTLSLNGRVASTGSGRACLGDPLLAVEWLARTAAEYGAPLRAGEIILSGALGPMVVPDAGDQIRVDISGFEPLLVTFGTLS